jgi:undecaprenyl-diphosphatase
MTFLQSIILGLIQGFCEILPISSGSHLSLIMTYLGWTEIPEGFDVMLHWGSLLAILVYFRKDVGIMLRGWGKLVLGQWKDPAVHLILWMMITTLPVILAGFLIESFPPLQYYTRLPVLLSLNSIIFGMLMYWANTRKSKDCNLFSSHKDKDFALKNPSPLSFKKGWFLGIAQSLALVQGVSRLGICITGARALGFDPRQALVLSFWMSMPTIAGATTLKVFKLYQSHHLVLDHILSTGLITTFLTSLVTLYALFPWLSQKKTISLLSLYRIFFGVISFYALF